MGNIGVENCSIDEMCQLLNEDSVVMTKQGLDFRFTEEAVEFMKRMALFIKASASVQTEFRFFIY